MSGTGLNPPTLFRLDLACKPLLEAFGGEDGWDCWVVLVGSVQERTAGPRSDVDVRLILTDEAYDALVTGPALRTMLDLALGAYLREMTGLPIDFQIQRTSEANERHAGKQRNPLGRRSLDNWIGDAAPRFTTEETP